MLALLAAYAFAWTRFRGRDFLRFAVLTLQIVPVQVTLVPLLSLFGGMNLSGTLWPVWISHSIFCLPLAIFLLHNFMHEIPSELIEASRIDGAGHIETFIRIILPLMGPAVAAFGIFQFLWVWNDLLIALTCWDAFDQSATAQFANMVGSRGNDWHHQPRRRIRVHDCAARSLFQLAALLCPRVTGGKHWRRDSNLSPARRTL